MATNDEDVDSPRPGWTVTVTTQPSNGTVSSNADGTLTQLVSHHDYPEFGDTVDLLVVGPTVAVTKTASQTEVFAPDGDLIEYTVEVHNLLGPFGQVTIDAMLDSKFGDLSGQGTCIPVDTLASGEHFSCTYEVWIAGDSGEINNVQLKIFTCVGTFLFFDRHPRIIADMLPGTG